MSLRSIYSFDRMGQLIGRNEHNQLVIGDQSIIELPDISNIIGVAVNKNNVIFLADSTMIYRILPTGQLSQCLHKPNPHMIGGIAIDDNDVIYFTDISYDVVYKLKDMRTTIIAGQYQCSGYCDGMNALFFRPRHLLYHDNNLLVYDSYNEKIRTISLDSHIVSTYYSHPMKKLTFISQMFVNNVGILYVVEYSTSISRIDPINNKMVPIPLKIFDSNFMYRVLYDKWTNRIVILNILTNEISTYSGNLLIPIDRRILARMRTLMLLLDRQIASDGKKTCLLYLILETMAGRFTSLARL